MKTTQDSKQRSSIGTALTFMASVAVGCGVAIAFAGVAAVSHAAPTLHKAQTTSAPATSEIVRLEPVVVTISRARFDQVRRDVAAEDTALARANDAKKVTRG